MNAFVEMARDHRLDLERRAVQQSVNELEDEIDSKNRQLDELVNKTSGELAYGAALAHALAQYEPNHPLLTSQELKDKVKAAGLKAVKTTNNYQSARDAGRATEVPPIKGDQAAKPTYAELVDIAKKTALRLADTVSDFVRHRAQRAAFRAELTRIDPDNPLVVNIALRSRISEAGVRAFNLAAPDDRWAAVDEAGRTFPLPSKEEAAPIIKTDQPINFLDVLHKWNEIDPIPGIGPDALKGSGANKPGPQR